VNAAYTPQQKGRLTYLAVCTGCHTYDSKLIGPPIVVVKALYCKDAVRLAVANYILNELSH
jgi:cytochrome c551/c552